jgi:hypothetical protein
VAELFGNLRSPVPAGHDYFVAAPPETLALSPEQLRALEVRAPFFVDHGWSFGPNERLVPFVWDRGSGGQSRFSEAESLTDYDSGSFGLAAVSAPTAEAQAQLYAVMAQAIVDIHRANRDLMEEWLEAQRPTSHEAFVYFDQERAPAQEKLLAADGTVDRALWDARLDELDRCISTGDYHKHHFRWIEFLAHAVDMPQLMQLIRDAQ